MPADRDCRFLHFLAHFTVTVVGFGTVKESVTKHAQSVILVLAREQLLSDLFYAISAHFIHPMMVFKAITY